MNVTDIDWSRYNFSAGELQCQGSGALALHPGFIDALQALREAYGKPMRITSGCRSQAHNAAVGGKSQSLHICDAEVWPGMKGALAVDVAIVGSVQARELAKLALDMGWTVGVPNLRRHFIHLDRRDLIGLEPGLFGY